ncbi:MAG TPA: ArsA family ATPase [Syntrophorhabdaceae bacterium]|nr:ArsA family ATPase [Syntrophorhabdaceae bacterium]
MGLINIKDDKLKLLMVGGKGGVGKTTCASSIALRFARDGKRVLLISSDPTPSLSDIFDIKIGDKETRITHEFNLYGLEISSDIVLKRWKERFGPEIYEVISSFARVDYDFVDYVGTAPGIEEEYMLNFIIELVEDDKYDLVVWDTAPAGHTLRLLQLPHLFLKHMEAATKFYMSMYDYFEKLKGAVTLKGSKRTLLEIISSWESLSEKIVQFIRDRETTKFIIITIPEALGVRLTDRIIEEFSQNDLYVENIIINHVVREADCEFHKKRKNMQEYYIDILQKRYRDINMVILNLEADEIKGIERIKRTGDLLFAHT